METQKITESVTMKLKQIKKLRDKIWDAKQKHEEAVKTLKGKTVWIEYGRSRFLAYVDDIGYQGDIWIINNKTEKRYRIDSYHVKEVLGE